MMGRFGWTNDVGYSTLARGVLAAGRPIDQDELTNELDLANAGCENWLELMPVGRHQAGSKAPRQHQRAAVSKRNSAVHSFKAPDFPPEF
jgi:hypothetical protein